MNQVLSDGRNPLMVAVEMGLSKYLATFLSVFLFRVQITEKIFFFLSFFSFMQSLFSVNTAGLR